MAGNKFEEVKRTLHNIRNKFLPPSSKNAIEINNVFEMENVYEEFGLSTHDEKLSFFKHTFSDDDFSYYAFASRQF